MYHSTAPFSRDAFSFIEVLVGCSREQSHLSQQPYNSYFLDICALQAMKEQSMHTMREGSKEPDKNKVSCVKKADQIPSEPNHFMEELPLPPR